MDNVLKDIIISKTNNNLYLAVDENFDRALSTTDNKAILIKVLIDAKKTLESITCDDLIKIYNITTINGVTIPAIKDTLFKALFEMAYNNSINALDTAPIPSTLAVWNETFPSFKVSKTSNREDVSFYHYNLYKNFVESKKTHEASNLTMIAIGACLGGMAYLALRSAHSGPDCGSHGTRPITQLPL